jgi:hypothetical protein
MQPLVTAPPVRPGLLLPFSMSERELAAAPQLAIGSIAKVDLDYRRWMGACRPELRCPSPRGMIPHFCDPSCGICDMVVSNLPCSILSKTQSHTIVRSFDLCSRTGYVVGKTTVRGSLALEITPRQFPLRSSCWTRPCADGESCASSGVAHNPYRPSSMGQRARLISGRSTNTPPCDDSVRSSSCSAPHGSRPQRNSSKPFRLSISRQGSLFCHFS